MNEAWFGLLGVVVGSVLTQGFTLVIEWRKWVREDRNRDRERLRAAVIALVESSGKAAFTLDRSQARDPWERMTIAHSEIFVLGSKSLVGASLHIVNLAQHAMTGGALSTETFSDAIQQLCSVARKELGLPALPLGGDGGRWKK